MTDEKNIGKTYDPVWDEIYGRNEQLNLYPVDRVVSFLFQSRAALNLKNRPLRVLEVGCGACNNLWFAAREGCEVAGIDASEAAIRFGQKRFSEETLNGDLRVGDFTALPFKDRSFDIAINRAALTQTGFSCAERAVEEVHRVLRPGGRFYNELYGTQTTAGGRKGPDGVTLDITGRLAGVGQICFYDKARIVSLFGKGWKILLLEHHELSNLLSKPLDIVGNWLLVAERSE